MLLCLFAAFAPPAIAHDLAGEMRVHAFVKPEGDRLHVLVRIPLALLLNVDLPKQGPGYLALGQIEPGIARAIEATDKGIDLFEDGRWLSMAQGTGRISLPSDRSFDSFDSARTLLLGPKLPDNSYVFWNQGYFDAYLEYPVQSVQSSFVFDFHIAPGLGDRLKVDLRYIAPGGVVRAYEFSAGSDPIALDPRWQQAAWTFVKSGFAHILDGPDHLLFLLCLVIPFRRLDWNLVGVITAFTVGHTITLLFAAYRFVPAGDWFVPLVEFLIAASILYMAVENLIKPDMRRRWLVTGIFGLVHGFGFSFLLQSQLQFAGSHLLLSLLAFNIGIELGQLLVLVIAMPALILLYRTRVAPEKIITAVLCLLIGHTAWHWLTERADALKEADWSTAADALTVPVLLAVFLLAVAAAVRVVLKRQGRGTTLNTPRLD
ncbi:HupE/UreJ family protein [Noviherbaspirillum sp.]|uniref:HupE/UreJ family protein n=1 Tax=Noviherbaspirillum sp. TaxID=1926288 RepID=UPI002FE213A5